MEEVNYVGTRTDQGCVVKRNGALLAPRNDLSNHSPTGFEWGYAGSGPAQLALALLADWTHDDEFAMRWHQRFKFDVITPMERQDNWSMTGEYIQSWIDVYRSQAVK